ncbi:ATP-dependent DNA helicase [Aquitalea pelogenes]|uniref:ATP-dependent DNA helicase n=1 Tax=Aquitalea pelogenes TaxID=1293573 RepID=UPI0035B0C9ED
MLGIINKYWMVGFDNKKYLLDQLAEIKENGMSQAQKYNSADIMAEANADSELYVPENALQRYTYAGGELFDEYGLTGALSEDNLVTISNLELGIDKRTKPHVKPVNRTIYSVPNPDAKFHELTQEDIKNGYYMNDDEKITFKPTDIKTRDGVQCVADKQNYYINITKKDAGRGYYISKSGKKVEFKPEDVKEVVQQKRKTGIEFVLTQDHTFSFAIALMTEEQRKVAEQIMMDSAKEAYEKMFKQYLSDYAGNEGKTGYYMFYHNDSRQNLPFSHIHLCVPNLVKLPNGEIKAIEIPEIKERDFHKKLDMMRKSSLVQKWQEAFGDTYPIEAYDKKGKSIMEGDENAEIADWRIAYDDESLKKIKLSTKAKEMIDDHISQEKLTLFQKVEIKRQALDADIEKLKLEIKSLDVQIDEKKEILQNLKSQLPENTKWGILVKHGSGELPLKEGEVKKEGENRNSYFVTCKDDYGTEHTIWSKALNEAIATSKAQPGEKIELTHLGKVPVIVKVPIKDEQTGKTRWEEREVLKNKWECNKSEQNRDDIVAERLAIIEKKKEVSNQIKDKQSEAFQLNKDYSVQIKDLESNKHRKYVWEMIKAPKEKKAKSFKDLEINKTAKEFGLKMKNDKIGVLFINKSDKTLINKLTNTSPFFSEAQLDIELSRIGHGVNAQNLTKQKIQEWKDKGLIVSTGADEKGQEKFTTFELMKKEYENVQMMATASNSVWKSRVHNRMDFEIQKILDNSPEGRKPEAEQLDFIRAIFDPKQATIAIGVPGAGKTFAVSKATEIANAYGYRTFGVAIMGKVKGALNDETSVNHAYTLDKLLIDIKDGKTKLTPNDVIFLDESSMVGTRHWNDLLTNLNGAKIVALGDHNQIASVAAGNTLKAFAKDERIQPNIKYLTEIRRQKNDEVGLKVARATALADVYRDGDEVVNAIKREGSHISNEQGTGGLDIMEAEGRVQKFVTSAEKYEAMVTEYLDDMNSFKEKVMLTSLNSTIDRLNNIAQDKRLIRGEISGEYLENDKERFYVGDRIILEANNNIEQYSNGDIGTVKGIVNGSLVVSFDNGKEKIIDDLTNTRLGYAMSINKSQGMSINSVYGNLESSSINCQEIFNVLVTRNKLLCKLFGVQSDYSLIKSEFMRENGKEDLIDMHKRYVTKEINPELDSLNRAIEVAEDLTAKCRGLEKNSAFLQSGIAAMLSDKIKKVSTDVEVPEEIKKQVANQELHGKHDKKTQQVQKVAEVNKTTEQVKKVEVEKPKSFEELKKKRQIQKDDGLSM